MFPKNWTRAALLTLLSLVSPLLLEREARADFMAGFSGNTASTDPGHTVNGFYDFAVLNRTGGTAQDPFDLKNTMLYNRFTPGVGSSALDTSAKYLYVFQIVNAGPQTSPILQGKTLLGPDGFITSYGTLSDNFGHRQVLLDGAGFVGVDKSYFGTTGSTISEDANSGGANGTTGSFHGGVTNPGIGTDRSAVVPIVSLVGDVLVMNFVTGSNPNGLLHGQTSTLIFFTSNLAPSYIQKSEELLGAGEAVALGESPIPTPSPEPSALALTAIGLGCCGGLALWRRRLRATLAAA